MSAAEVEATVNVVIERDPAGRPVPVVVRRTRTRSTRTTLTATELATLVAEGAVALKIIEEHRPA